MFHVLAVAWLWHAGLSPRIDADTGPARQMEVRLVPLAPAAPHPVPAPEADAPRSRPAPAPALAEPPQARRQPRAPAPSPAPAATSGALPDHVADHAADHVADGGAASADAAPGAATVPGAAAPAVDLAAARATARLVARERGNGLLATESRKPVVDPNADRRVVSPLERARRVDCQTARAESTNLLANVVLLAVDLAKNAVDDSGCKW
ncbi:hypothetical protein [Massilia sp. TN1-12]|uniref:hypothetical protein n=1 Tax=Massilia paldalensis TaxID=3377675 RepID=UPI00384C64C2